jgi:NAD(P)-dependent dehydrogenase (short-subunit alcohol dehydrogenase family)
MAFLTARPVLHACRDRLDVRDEKVIRRIAFRSEGPAEIPKRAADSCAAGSEGWVQADDARVEHFKRTGSPSRRGRIAGAATGKQRIPENPRHTRELTLREPDRILSVKELFDLSGRVAIVTGGSVGLGRQMAEGLAEMGASLALCARKIERCEQAAEELRKLGGKVLPLACDVKDPASIQACVNRTVAEFGGLDILINNAGTSWGAPVEEMALEHWNKVIETNLTGTFLFSQAAGKVMIGQRSGKIINVASVAGLRGAPPYFQAAGYHASKGGVIAFTKDLACKWACHNIHVNAIAPGWFPTHMSNVVIERNRESLLKEIPLGRFGGASDLKGAAVFLASAASDFVTGQVLVVDGGQLA